MFLDSCWILVPGVIRDPFVLYLPLLLQLTGTPRPANWKSAAACQSPLFLIDWPPAACLFGILLSAIFGTISHNSLEISDPYVEHMLPNMD